MACVDIVTALAVLQFLWLTMRVGSARGKYGVKAPAVTGNDIFERHFRVQQNTLEQLIMFLPGLYLFSRYFDPLYAAALGAFYLIGRTLYALSYVKNPGSRGAGFTTSFVPTIVLIAGGLIGAVIRVFGH
jgi:glutathione S-transferase